MTMTSREARAYDAWLTDDSRFYGEPTEDDACECGGDHAAEDHDVVMAGQEDADR